MTFQSILFPETLHEQLEQKGAQMSFPSPAAPSEGSYSFRGLHDICPALSVKESTVSNDLNADGKDLVTITGANQGGIYTNLHMAFMTRKGGRYFPTG